MILMGLYKTFETSSIPVIIRDCTLNSRVWSCDVTSLVLEDRFVKVVLAIEKSHHVTCSTVSLLLYSISCGRVNVMIILLNVYSDLRSSLHHSHIYVEHPFKGPTSCM